MNGIFYMIVRIFVKFSGQETHSVQYFKQEDYGSIDEMLRATRARYHNVCSADLTNEEIAYQQCFAVDNSGNYVAGCLPFIDDRRATPQVSESNTPEQQEA